MAGVRKRRSAEEAKDAVLSVAEGRLADLGLDGLNIVDVARDAGMSHATLIHHFGNTDGMRRELVHRMTDRLLHDIINALQNDNPDPVRILEDLFDALSRGGHAKLLAWLSLGGGDGSNGVDVSPHVEALFAKLIATLASQLPGDWNNEDAARRIVMLISSTAIGHGIGGDVLKTVTGVDEQQYRGFPAWLAEQIGLLIRLRSDV